MAAGPRSLKRDPPPMIVQFAIFMEGALCQLA